MESDTIIYGLLGRIHVLTRRELNRITDVEYMRVNKEYALEIVRLGEADGHPELVELCAKLRVAMALDLVTASVKPSQGRFLPKLVNSIIPREASQYVGALR